MIEKIFSYFVEACLILLIIVSPLFYGSLLPLPRYLLEIFILLLMAAFLVKLVVSLRPTITFPPAIIFFMIFFGLVLLQTIPLPASLLSALSPKTADLYQRFGPDNFQAQLHTVSIYSFNTKNELVQYVCFMGLFLVVLNGIARKKQLERLCGCIIIWATLLCLYGLVRKYLILEKTLTDSFSVFGNRNHFAAYMVMVVPLAIGYAISCTDRFKKILFLFLGALICASIFLSGSRGGALSVIIALCGVFILLQHYDVVRRKAWVVFAGLAAGVFLMGLVGFEPLKERFLISGMAMDRRLLVLYDASAVAKDFPLWGVGLGNFHHIFTMYRSSVSPSFWYYLHNDHFQLVLETGVIASGCYFYFLFLMFRSLFRQLGKRHDHFVLGMVVGGACGLLGVLLHSFFDFNFHIPAISFLFWFLLGVTYKGVHTRFER